MKFVTFKRQSKLIENRLTKILEHCNTLSDLPAVLEKHKQRAQSLSEETQEKNAEYQRIKDKLLNDPSSLDTSDEEELEGFDGKISDLIIDIQSLLRPLLPEAADDSLNDSNNTSRSHDSHLSNVRLPKIQLKTFNGDIAQWIAFHNIFDITVHKNKTLTNIEKFQYLLSCLQNEPLNLIKALPLTNENYTVAYDTLITRYHNPRVLKSLHINHIIDMPNCHETNAKSLRHFISQFSEHSSALSSLDINIHDDNPVLVTLMLRKFDIGLRTHFETKRENAQNMPTPDEFIKFLNDECSFMENAHLTNSTSVRPSMHHTSQSHVTLKPKPSIHRIKNVALTAQGAAHTLCTYCNSDHLIYTCPQFGKLSSSERFTYIKSNGHCVNCLGTHKLKECMSKSTCKRCFKRHHTLLHLNIAAAQSRSSTHTSASEPSKRSRPLSDNAKVTDPTLQTADCPADTPCPVQSVCAVNVKHALFTTVLGTLLVKISSSSGNDTVVRALIDSASSCSFINSDVVNKLKLKRQFSKQLMQVNGICATSVNTKGITHINIHTLNNKQVSSQHPVLILDKITSDMPTASISGEVKQSLMNFKLADPHFDKSGPIQMLIGADLFMQIIKPAKYSLGENMPYALDTEFGFVIIGKAPIMLDNHSENVANCTTLVCIQEDPLHKLMTNFWISEQPPELNKLTDDELACEKHFAETHHRSFETGKYTVRLPFKENPDNLGDSSLNAKRRFFALEKKMDSKPEFKDLYLNFMKDYEDAGHMQQLNKDISNCPHYFLPHHGVFKDSSSSTRLRVVFDASAKTTHDFSLNDLLHVGPKLHNDIATIIINFRRYQYVFTTDVKQMFRSIDVDLQDRNYQLIYWRDNSDKALAVYQLNTVTYGMACSPYLANRVIQQLAEDEAINFPKASIALKNHIYVDDIALGSDKLDDAVKLQHDVICMLKSGGFELRKWTANNEMLLTGIPKEFCEQPINFRTPDQPLVSILGLQWMPNIDCFTYKINVSESKVCTKRSVLSDIAKIYDPCGFLAPVVVLAKIFIQILWTRGLEWDTALPTDLATQWSLLITEFPLLEQLTLQRFLKTATTVNTQLHGFCDSSESAYGACVYIRTVDPSNNIEVMLVIAKTRVAPLKRTSLPRLELCGAHLLAQLMEYCTNIFSKYMHFDSIHAWTDSTVTLAWIATPSYKLKTFVANRVAQIQQWLPARAWAHVPSAQNPADCASRGIIPSQLIHHTLWWTGPQWLALEQSEWPNTPVNTSVDTSAIPELKPLKGNVFLLTQPSCNALLNKYSSWDKLKRIVSYILRFKHNSTNKIHRLTGYLSSNELQKAEFTICRVVQLNDFSSEYENLQKNKPVTGKIQSLCPFIGADGLIRVGGRLKHAKINYKAKYPILLSKSHVVSKLIVDFYHLKYMHAGPQLLQSLLSKTFWILSARDLIRSRVHMCMTCFKHRPTTLYPIMGNLPEARVNPAPCFQSTGLDYGGPFNVKIHTLRRAQTVKSYLCLFVCFATKAVHVEVVSDLSTDTFIAALVRFISRRGAPTDLYLDNATNFVGACNKLDKVIRDILRNEATKSKLNELSISHSIKFHFIPPSAPHHGGIWESGIKSVKTHLKKVIGERTLTLEEFQTLTVRVEAILNSRPLCPLSTDPTELEVLTPGHFLIGRPIVALPEEDLIQMPLNRLKRWQAVQAMTQQLWKRWQVEYLHTLQQRGKWTRHQPNIQVNDLVLIHESCTPPQTWSLGRVTNTHPGDDGVTRVVTLRTAKGSLTRPVVKVSPLPKY